MGKCKQVKICDYGGTSINQPRIVSGAFDTVTGVLTLTRNDGSKVTASIPAAIGSSPGGSGAHIIVDGEDNEMNQRANLKFGPSFIVSDLPLDDQTYIEDTIYVTELDDALEMPEAVGGLPSGTTVADLKGDSLSSIIDRILFPLIVPTYTNSTLSLSGSSPYLIKVGELFSPSLTLTFTQNDAGAVTGYSILKDAVEVSATSSYTDTDIEFTSPGTYEYTGEATYNQGPILNDNYGDPYPTGQINAGTAYSLPVIYTGIYPWYWGVSSSNTIDSSTITSGNELLESISGDISFFPVASSEYIWVAVPASTSTFTNWQFTALNSGNITAGSLFEGIDSIVSVTSPGSGSGFTTNYEVYVTAYTTTTSVNPSIGTLTLSY